MTTKGQRRRPATALRDMGRRPSQPIPPFHRCCSERYHGCLVPGGQVVLTDARILNALTLRTRVALKRELQRLCRAHSAAAGFLWTATRSGSKACGIELAGDPDALPRSHDLKGACSNVCEQRTLRSIDGEEREVVLLYSRICTGSPVLILGLVESRAPFTDVLTDDMEGAIETVESLIVDLLDPPATSPQPAQAKPARRV